MAKLALLLIKFIKYRILHFLLYMYVYLEVQTVYIY